MKFKTLWTGFKDNTLDILKNHYWDVNGRVDLWNFWLWAFFAIAGGSILGVLLPPAACVFAFAMFPPCISIVTRRLHDLNKSGWLQIIIYVIPCIGMLAILYMCTLHGKDEDNRYGPPPPRRHFDL